MDSLGDVVEKCSLKMVEAIQHLDWLLSLRCRYQIISLCILILIFLFEQNRDNVFV